MNRALILMYHIIDEPVVPKERKLCCPVSLFQRHLDYLRRSKFNVVSLPDLLDCTEKGTDLPDNAVVLTFDDGFSCFYESAFPLLREYDFPAALFVVSGLLGGANEWMTSRGFSRRKLIPARVLREMADAGISIGSHTVSHPRLTEIAPEQVEEEIVASRKMLEDVLGRNVDLFAYPHGDHNEEIMERVRKAVYRAACSTRSGFNRIDVDPFQLRRIEVAGDDSPGILGLKMKLGTNEAGAGTLCKYYTSRATARLKFLRGG